MTRTLESPASIDDVYRVLVSIRSLFAEGSAQLLNATASARFLGVGKSTFYRMVSSERMLRSVATPGGKRWRRSDLQAYVDGLQK